MRAKKSKKPKKKVKNPVNFNSGNKQYVDFEMSRDRARDAFARQLNEDAGRKFDDLKGRNETRNFSVGNTASGGTRFFLSEPAS